jgi:23S rRNA (uracil1939-C5)-methyltransferase
VGDSAIQYEVAGERYRVSARAFFQVNRDLLPKMVELVVDRRQGGTALDLYSGVGLFAVPLARRFERLVAVESSPVSLEDLRQNLPPNGRVHKQAVEAYLASVSRNLKPDVVIVDPPRAGLGPRVCSQLSRLPSKEIVYISCDPATLGRDLKELISPGWHITAMHLLDMFPQTFHIETITILHNDRP